MRLALALVPLLMACSDYGFHAAQGEEGGDDPDGSGDDGGGGDGGQLDDDGGITGKICNPSGDGMVVGADVWADVDTTGDGALDTTLSTQTDGDGVFLLENVPAGTWTVNVQKGSFSTSFSVMVEDTLVELNYDECLEAEDVEIAVVSGSYDSIEHILDDMALDYDLYDGTWTGEHVALLRSKPTLAQYDIIFFNCGMSDMWMMYDEEVTQNLSDYVAGGGSVYASDWAYWIVEATWPSYVTFLGNDSQYGAAQSGVEGRVSATVLDANLIAVLGSEQAELNYDLGAWVVAESAGTGTETLVRGTASTYGSQVNNAPLAVRHHDDDGTVLYTTFHNESQITVDMKAILEEFILSL